uniref:Transmembrane protein n=1 Tax=Cacopsylla melanoneura TaxID=428564 RepID=A0A8D9AR15_9HEMI
MITYKLKECEWTTNFWRAPRQSGQLPLKALHFFLQWVRLFLNPLYIFLICGGFNLISFLRKEEKNISSTKVSCMFSSYVCVIEIKCVCVFMVSGKLSIEFSLAKCFYYS